MKLNTTLKTTVSSLLCLCLSASPLPRSTLTAQSQGEWSAVQTGGADPEARHESAFVRLGDLFYLIGGRGTRKIQVYDPVTKAWSNTATSTENIHHFQAQAHQGKIYLLGALTQGFPNENPLTNVLIYHPQQDKLLTGATIPAGRRRGSSGIVVYNNVFYLVAGNRNGHSAFLDDGTTPANVAWTDKFDPATGTWTVLPDAPHARDHFFAEVIGDKIYVAGGRRSRVGTTDGAWKDTETAVDVFDLTTETWLTGGQLPDALPTARAGAATAVINNELLVIGGEIYDNPPSNLALPHTEVLDPSSGKWRRADDLVLQRHATQAIVYQDEVFVVAGSKTRGGTEITKEETFMESFTFGGAGGMGYNDWTNIGNGPVPRSEATSITYQGSYYIFNGFDREIDIYDRVEKYNPATNTYSSLAPMPTIDGQRTAVTHNGIALVGDVVWIIGGRVDDHPGRVTDAVWLYDISDNLWRKGPPLPARRGGGGVGRLGRTLHYVGGFDENAQCDVDDHLMYDLDNPSAGWQDLTASSPLPLARNHVAAVSLDGKLYIVGGQHGHDGCGGGVDQVYVHAYDPTTDKWTRVADMPSKQSHAEQSTFAYNGKVLSVGGAESGGKGVWEYDPADNKWTVLSNMQLPVPLMAPSVRIYRGNMVVLNGGSPHVGEPISTSRVKTFGPSITKALSFNLKNISLETMGDQRKSASVILSNLDAESEIPYTIKVDDLPGWLSVDRPTGLARESFSEINLTADPAGLPDGTYNYTLEATSAGYQSASLAVKFTVKGSNGAVNLWLEAECGALGSNWRTIGATGVSGGSYVEPLPGKNSTGAPPADVPANRVSYTISLPQPDAYRLHARIKAPSGGDDSYWVRVNGGNWIKWWQGLQTNAFAWREVLGSPFNLAAGTVRIDFAYREDGTLLDKLYLTNSDTKPGQLGGTATNCGPTTEPEPELTVVRINAGGPTLNYQANTYAADQAFAGGKIYTNTSATVPALYQSERRSEAPYQYAYRIPVPDGEYTVRLHFAEIYFGASGGGPGGTGKRVFDVTLENSLVLDNFDINAEVGPQTVTVKEYNVKVTDGAVDLFLDASTEVGGTNQPKLSALEVIGIKEDGDPQSPAGNSLSAEAECSQTGSNWQQFSSAQASGGSYRAYPGNGYLAAPTQNNTAELLTYSVDLTEAGAYVLFFRMKTPDVGRNSFWVSVDAGKWIKFWRQADGGTLLTNGFEWREVNDDASPLSLTLSAGSHTVRVAPRELGTQLDKVYLGQSTTPPTGLGDPATNCSNSTFAAATPSPSQQSLRPLAGEVSLSLYPNPASERLNLVLEVAGSGHLEVQLIDLNGRLLQAASYERQQSGPFTTALEVSALPAGSYRLRVIGSALPATMNRSFIKVR